MSNLQAQADITANMTSSLQQRFNAMSDMSANISRQINATQALNKSLESAPKNIENLNSSLENILTTLNNIEKIKFQDENDFAKKVLKEIDKIKRGEKSADESMKEATAELENASSSTQQAQAAAQQTKKKLDLSRITNLFSKQTIKKLWKRAKESCYGASLFKSIKDLAKKAYEKLKETASDLLKGVGKLVFAIPVFGQILKGLSIVGSIVMNVFSVAYRVFATSMSIFFSLVKTVMSLPFTIARNFIGVGNSLRTEIIEQIGNKVESIKDDFDFNSYTGRSLQNVENIAKDSLLEIKNNRSRLAKIFGYDNPTAILDAALQNTKAVGIFSEYIGASMNSSIENITYITEVQRALGISQAELKYYGLEAVSQVKDVISVLHENVAAIKKVKEDSGQDTKLISKEFHKLRMNITQFGHLSAIELAEVSAEVVKMKLSAEDLVSVFNSVSSFESAANMSAQLFQSFGMVIDAFDMVSANNPLEIIKSLRDGLLDAGKSFNTLNRHEKALLKQLTGLSDEKLKTTFSYEGLSLSQEELREKMEEKDPAKIMIESLKTMSSSIRSIIKVVNFSNPFEAIFKGINDAAARNKEMTGGAISLSEAYEALQLSMYKIPEEDVLRVLRPLNVILSRFHKLITDGTLTGLIEKSVSATGDFFIDVYAEVTDTSLDNQLLDYTYALESLSKLEDKNANKVYNTYFEKLKQQFDSIYKQFPEQMKELLSRKGLVDDKGNIKNLSVEQIKNVLLTALESKDKALKSGVETSLKSLETSGLDVAIKQLAELNSDIKEKIVSSKGINRIIERLYEGISSLIDEGKPIFTGIFNLGATIFGGIIKGAFIGTTAFLHLINGKIEKASNILSEYTNKKYSKNGELRILELIGFKKGEMSTLTDNLNEQVNKTADVSSDKLTFVFKVIYNEITAGSKLILDMLTSILYTGIVAAYETLEEGSKAAMNLLLGDKLQAARFFKTQKGLSESPELVSKDERDFFIKKLVYQTGDLLGNKQAAIYKKSLSKEKNKNIVIYKKLRDNLDLGRTDKRIFAGKIMDDYLLYKNLGNITLLLTQKLKDEEDSDFKTRSLTNKNNITGFKFRFEEFLRENDEKKHDAIVKSYQSFKENIKESLKKVKNSTFSEKIVHVQDMIKLDDKDKVEIIASKQGGMIIGVINEVKEKYKAAIENVKVSKDKNKLSTKEMTYNENEECMLALISEIDTYISNLKNKKQRIIRQEKIEFR